MKYFAVLLLLCCLMASVLATLKSPICGEDYAKIGDCRAALPRWSYREDKNECIQFSYSGCHGNQNLFDDKLTCEQTCVV